MLPVRRVLLLNAERRQQININRAELRMLRDNSDPFQLTNERFIELFRLNKDLARYLIEELGPHLQQPQRITGIPTASKVLAALTFYATGTYQRALGQSYLIALSQQSMSRIVNEVSEAIYYNIAENWIQFPQTANNKLAIKRRFMQTTHFPGVIGAIDCTHIAILKPSREEHNYLNRKGYHSKNVQIICDYDLKILSINARYAGATHDSFIWRESAIQRELSTCFEQGDRASWLIGDSGYPQQPWLMTPVLNPQPNSPSERYNLRHASARNCIERCNGVLKSRFRCIMDERVLRYNPEIVGKITTACAVLHNMCRSANLEWDIPENPQILNNNDIQRNAGNDLLNINIGNQHRLDVIRRYFQ